MIYFDHNATTPLSHAAKRAWIEAAEEFPANPSSPHRLGARAEAALAGAREELARLLDCAAFDLVWTSGATESNNMVLHHLSRTLSGKKEVWVSAIEHPCILSPAQHYFGKMLRHIPVSGHGVVDLDWIERRLSNSQRPALIAVMAANNETGVIQPWQTVLKLCREHDVPFFCDAAQWIGKMPAQNIGQCDWVSGCAHKFGGPKGVGFVKCPSSGAVTPLIFGGEQEEGRRSGTENVAGVLAMIAALEECESRIGCGKTQRAQRTLDTPPLHSLSPGERAGVRGNSASLSTTPIESSKALDLSRAAPQSGSLSPRARAGGRGNKASIPTEPFESCNALDLSVAPLSIAQAERQQWRNEFEAHLLKRLPHCKIVGASEPRLWNTVAALMPQANCQQRWVVKLDKAGFAVSTGSACSSGKEKPSHVLQAMGLPADASNRMLRFSSGWQTTKEEWDQLADAILRVNSEMAQRPARLKRELRELQ